MFSLLHRCFSSAHSGLHRAVFDISASPMVDVLNLVDLFEELCDIGLVECRTVGRLSLILNLLDLNGGIRPYFLLDARHGWYTIVKWYALTFGL